MIEQKLARNYAMKRFCGDFQGGGFNKRKPDKRRGRDFPADIIFSLMFNFEHLEFPARSRILRGQVLTTQRNYRHERRRLSRRSATGAFKRTGVLAV